MQPPAVWEARPMADFHQTGVVTTLHRLKPNNIDRLEADLEKFSETVR
jgi:hypothetical protein